MEIRREPGRRAAPPVMADDENGYLPDKIIGWLMICSNGLGVVGLIAINLYLYFTNSKMISSGAGSDSQIIALYEQLNAQLLSTTVLVMGMAAVLIVLAVGLLKSKKWAFVSLTLLMLTGIVVSSMSGDMTVEIVIPILLCAYYLARLQNWLGPAPV